MRVRTARVTDIDWLLEQLKSFDVFVDAKKSLFPAADVQARSILTNFVMSQPFFVAEGFDGMVGFIAGTLGPHYLNPELRVLTEVFWWVDPKYRGTSAGARLLQVFTALGRLKADWIVMTLEEKSPIDPESLLRRGFHPFESIYLLEVEQ
jgi:N-acetylglutamate synthase-like GNAT family acetyltransferase